MNRGLTSVREGMGKYNLIKHFKYFLNPSKMIRLNFQIIYEPKRTLKTAKNLELLW